MPAATAFLFSGCFDEIEQAPAGVPPGNVGAFNAIAGDGQIGLSWTNPTEPDFSGVLIKRDITAHPFTTSDGTLVYQSSGTGFTDGSVINGVEFFYTAFAFDNSNNFSSGARASGRPTTSGSGTDTSPPGNVTGFSALPADSQITLSWNNPTDSDFTGVLIRRKTTGFPASLNDGNLIFDGPGASFQETGLANGTTYFYSAFAHDGVPNYASGAQTGATPISGITGNPSAWTVKTPSPIQRSHTTSSVLNGKIYVVGGNHPTLNLLDSLEIYDPATDSWSTGSPMLTPRANLTSAVAGGKFYAIGGGIGVANVFEEYDPGTDSWTAKSSILVSTNIATSASVNGIIYVFEDGGNTQAYDPVMDSWSVKKAAPSPRGGMEATAVGGKIYLIGGAVVSGSTSVASGLVEVYDPVLDSWETKNSLQLARFGHVVTTVQGLVYVLGGLAVDFGPGQDFVEAYDPTLGTWVTKTPMPLRNYEFAGSAVGDKIYLIGGTLDSTGVYEYDPSLDL